MKEDKSYKHQICIGFNDILAGDLINSIYNKNIDELDKLLRSGYDIRETDSHGNSVIFWGIHVRNLDVLKTLHRNKVFDNCNSDELSLALKKSISSFDQEIWSWWLDTYPQVYANSKSTCIRSASSSHNIEFLEMSLNDGIDFDINYQSLPDKLTNLHVAAAGLYERVFKILIDYGADPVIKNALGENVKDFLAAKTSLSKAQRKSRDIILKLLEDKTN